MMDELLRKLNLENLNASLLTNLSHIYADVKQRKKEDSDDAPGNTWFSTLLAVIAALGVLGNLINLSVLTRRRLYMSLDRLERSSNYGLFALAVSDLIICTVVIPHAFLGDIPGDQKLVRGDQWGLLIYKIYGLGIINMFMMVSMWQIVSMAVHRYIIVVYPLHARLVFGKKSTLWIIGAIYVVSFVITLPHFIHSYVKPVTYDTVHYEMTPLFSKEIDTNVKWYIRWIWPVCAVFLPTTILVICNCRLVKDLHHAFKSRNDLLSTTPPYVPNNKKRSLHTSSTAVTLTLVIIVLVVVFFIAPAEVVRYINPYTVWGFDGGHKAAKTVNFLQILGFASNFVLYCVINGRFRQTLWNMISSMKNKDKSQTTAARRQYNFARNTKVCIRSGVHLSEPLRTTVTTNLNRNEQNNTV